MNPFVIQLPGRVFEERIPNLLSLLNRGDEHEAVEIDISRVEFITPAAIVAVLARCHFWWKGGKTIYLGGIEQCQSLGYLQRIDFLKHLGIDYPENFRRHPAADRFVPVQSLTFASGNVDLIVVHSPAPSFSRCGIWFELL